MSVGCTVEFCHFIFLGYAAVMFWSKSCSVPQTIKLFPGPGSRTGLTARASHAVFHDTCSGSWLQFTLAKGYYSLSWINEFEIHE